MTSPYFLTRQTANLMEDFARELAAGSELYLLYGEPRVGKTRLLEELRRNRLGDRTVHWIDIANAPEDMASADLSAEIERLFEQAAPGDVVIADHFELALKKTRHQLFLSWSTDGVDKRLNLIVASNLEGFNELRQLSQQYQVRVQSYQLMPLDADESEAFLGHYLFPDHPLGKLTMPAPLRRQVADARGIIGNLIEIADHDGSHIETAPLADGEPLRGGGRIIGAVLVLVLFAVALGVGWYFFAEPEPSLAEIPLAPAPATEPPTSDDVDLVVAPEPAPAADAVAVADSAEAAPAGESVAEDDAPAPEADGAPPADSPAASTGPAAAAGDPALDAPASAAAGAADEVAVAVSRDDAGDTAEVTLSAPAGDDLAVVPVVDQSIDAQATARPVAPETAPVGGEPAADAVLARIEPAPPGDRLLRELKRSIEWLSARDENRGTIQVLLLSYESFDPAGYFDYVDDLGRRQVDTAQLRIVKTFTGGKIVYSVFFGEYETRQAALRAIDELPDALRRAGPIPRSLGGIWQEIRRLPEKN